MNAAFGIDHPLIAVENIERLRGRLISLGFNMTKIGRHPWGTSTSLAMFDGCLLEIMGVYDEGLLDKVPAGDFRFGRHIQTHLLEREGIALAALHSTDAIADAKRAEEAGFLVSGHLEFGRDVTLPNGKADRTKTTLALLPDKRWPRLSFFLCQQHRPDLIYVPAWLEHPNTVFGIGGVTVMARLDDHPALIRKFKGLYGSPASIDDGFKVETANGPIRVQSKQAIEQDFGPLPTVLAASDDPGIVGVDLHYESVHKLRHWIGESGLDCMETNGVFTLTDPALTGNTFLRFHLSETSPNQTAAL